MDSIYNPEWKAAFLETRNEMSQRDLGNTFRRTKPWEEKLEKDVFRFRLEELQEMFVGNAWDVNHGTLKVRLALIRSYLVWCCDQKAKNIGVPPARLRTRDFLTERTRRDTDFSECYKDYEEFQETANRVLSSSGLVSETKTVCLLLCSLCFLGFKINEIARMRFSDVDLESGVFRLPAEQREAGEDYEARSEKVAVLAKQCMEIYEAHFRSREDYKLITDISRGQVYNDKPANNPAWTTKKYWRLGLEKMRQDGVDEDDLPASFKHYSISLSGQYSRIYDEIGDDFGKLNAELAKKYIRAKNITKTKLSEAVSGYRKWYQQFHGE